MLIRFDSPFPFSPSSLRLNRFFERIDRILRRALGVAEDAPTEATILPAPEPELEEPAGDELTKKLAQELDEDAVYLDEPPKFEDRVVTVQDKIKTPKGAGGIPEVIYDENGNPDIVMENVKVIKDEL